MKNNILKRCFSCCMIFFVISGIILLNIFSTHIYAYDMAVNDTFEDSSGNINLNNWSATYNEPANGNVVAVTNSFYGHSNSLKVAGVTKGQTATRTFAPLTGTVVVELDMLYTDVSKFCTAPYIKSSDGKILVAIMSAGGGTAGKLWIRNGANLATTGVVIQNNTWCHYKVVINTGSSTFDIYLDNNLLGSGYGYMETPATNNVSKIDIGTSTASNTHYVDNLQVFNAYAPTISQINTYDKKNQPIVNSLNDAIPQMNTKTQKIEVKLNCRGFDLDEGSIVKGTNIKLKNSTTNSNVNFDMAYDKTTNILTMSLNEALMVDTNYSLELTGVKNTLGLGLTAKYSFNVFTTITNNYIMNSVNQIVNAEIESDDVSKTIEHFLKLYEEDLGLDLSEYSKLISSDLKRNVIQAIKNSNLTVNNESEATQKLKKLNEALLKYSLLSQIYELNSDADFDSVIKSLHDKCNTDIDVGKLYYGSEIKDKFMDSAIRTEVRKKIPVANYIDENVLSQAIKEQSVLFSVKNAQAVLIRSILAEITNMKLKQVDYSYYDGIMDTKIKMNVMSALELREFATVDEFVNEFVDKSKDAYNKEPSNQKVATNNGDTISISVSSSEGYRPLPTSVPMPTDTPIPIPALGSNENIVFSDIEDFGWAKDAINTLNQKGIINGKGQGIFSPNSDVTRAEILTMLIKAFDISPIDEASQFNDVSSSDWYAPYVVAASKQGLVNGFNNQFKPNEKITRQDLTVMINNFLKLISKDIQKSESKELFNDNDSIALYAKDAVYLLKQYGIVQGFENNIFQPLDYTNRAQAATLVFRVFKIKVQYGGE